MVFQPKKHDPKKLRVCLNFRWLNKVTLIDPFPTPFVDEIINEVAGHECYSFTDSLLGYNQVAIAKENQHKTTFVCVFGSFSYIVMSFSLENAPLIFSRIVIKYFQEYLYKTMALYFNDWINYNILKEHVKWIKLILERCIHFRLSLNINKFIFATINWNLTRPYSVTGIKVILAKIKVILDLKPPVKPKHVKEFLGHTTYYRKFVSYYSNITYPIEDILRINVPFI